MLAKGTRGAWEVGALGEPFFDVARAGGGRGGAGSDEQGGR
jgi:hypothetical protein